MSKSNLTTGTLPRGSRTRTHNPSLPGRKRTSSTVSSKTRALRGSTGLTGAQEERINASLKQLAHDLHGEDWSGITVEDRSALCRKVAAVMRKETGLSIRTDQVRLVAQRMRSTPEVKTGYPVDLEPEEYAYIAHKAATDGMTMKAVNSSIIKSYREQNA